MSKATVIRALLCTLVLSCLPAVAATILPDIKIRFSGAERTGPNRFLVHTDTMPVIDVYTEAGSFLWVYAVRVDASGQPDYSAYLSFYLDVTATGHVQKFIPIPAVLAGQTFQLEAQSLSPTGMPRASEHYTVDVAGQQVLYPPSDVYPPLDPPHAVRADWAGN